MEILNVQVRPTRNLRTHPKPKSLMNSFLSKLKLKQLLLNPSVSPCLTRCLTCERGRAFSRSSVRVNAKVAAIDVAQLKENWLDSLTCPTIGIHGLNGSDASNLNQTGNAGSNWVIGIDPDISGALALLNFDDLSCSAQVFDSPHLKVMVGRRIRKRLDAKSMVQLLRSFDVPIGTTAYIEQSIPFPQDGKLGWWNGGFGYGLWIGILVASGFSVVPVPSFTWKSEYEFTGGKSTKDDCRQIASTLFPSLSSSLKRKKDHGRAEALLIAAYGKGLMMKSAGSCALQEVP